MMFVKFWIIIPIIIINVLIIKASFLKNSRVIEDDIIRPPSLHGVVLHHLSTWPNAYVPFTLNSNFSDYELEMIQLSMNHISTQSCLKFKKRDNEADYIEIKKSIEPMCSSLVGKWRAAQPIRLGPGCFKLPLILHELLHAIGFFHTHNRSDRDCFLKIHWNNINKTHYFQFLKNERYYERVFAPFDFDSIMLYGSYLLSSNKKPTLTRLNSQKALQNPLEKGKLSKWDVLTLNLMYKCPLNDHLKQLQKEAQKYQIPASCKS